MLGACVISLLVGAATAASAAGTSGSIFSRAAALREVSSVAKINEPQSAAYKAYTFDQPIDHFPNEERYAPHTKATFKQRYYFDATYYRDGGPVLLYIGGETDGPSRFSNLQTGIIQILMNATNGLGVILENRYYGESQPFNSSTTDQLAYLSNEQTIADIAHFAQNAIFPGVNHSLTAPDTPWILYGGSFAGAQVAFAMEEYSEVLYGGIASSAPVNASLAYWQWFDPVLKYAPGDCVASIVDIIAKFDGLVETGNEEAVNRFKELFNMSSVTDVRDFAAAIAAPIGSPMHYPGESWQELSWYDTDAEFWKFCAAVADPNPPHEIRAVDYAMPEFLAIRRGPWTNLGNYANYIKTQYNVAVCPSGDLNSANCFGTQYPSLWNRTANTANRASMYTACTEAGFYLSAPPAGYPSLISRVLQPSYTQEWCTWAFPPGEHNRLPASGPDLNLWNQYGALGFWNAQLAFIDGAQDPWNEACVHSTRAPERISGPFQYLIASGGHHWDSYGGMDADQFVREAHAWEIRTVKRWLAGFGTVVPM